LVFNSHYDHYKGVVVWVRVVDGQLSLENDKKRKVSYLGTGIKSEVLELGHFLPEMKSASTISSGEVGYLATGLKEVSFSFVGDTVVMAGDKKTLPLAGYQKAKPMVFAGLYPVDNDDFSILAESLQKLQLSDSALSFTPELSQGLGKGFRCGFLGLLHAEIVQERLKREFGVDLVITSPTVNYRITKKNGKVVRVAKATDFPSPNQIEEIYEPVVELTIFTPIDYIASLIELCKSKRGELVDQAYFGAQVRLKFEMPLAEMVVDFYDLVKSISSGFASLDWEPKRLAQIDAIRLDVLLNGQKIDAFSKIVPRKHSQREGKAMVKKLKKLIPKQLFEVAIQAAIGSKIVARETISPFRKDVTAKLYGGDRTRRMKLLEKQKEGKKRMKQVGKAVIPQEVFLEVFKR
jgi:GTP-binding protein LepA